MPFTVFDFHDQAEERGENGHHAWAMVSLLYNMRHHNLTFEQAAFVGAGVAIDYKLYKLHVLSVTHYVRAAKKRYPGRPTPYQDWF